MSARRGRGVIRPYVDPGTLPAEGIEHPVFELDRASGALERALYRHILQIVDLDALFGLEQRLWRRLQELGPFTDEQVLDLANALIERALQRLGRDPRRALQEAAAGPDGHVAPIPDAPHEGCPLCEPEGGDPDLDPEGGGPAPASPARGDQGEAWQEGAP